MEGLWRNHTGFHAVQRGLVLTEAMPEHDRMSAVADKAGIKSLEKSHFPEDFQVSPPRLELVKYRGRLVIRSL